MNIYRQEKIRYPEKIERNTRRDAKGCDALCAQIIDLFSPYLAELSDGKIISLQDKVFKLLEKHEKAQKARISAKEA